MEEAAFGAARRRAVSGSGSGAGGSSSLLSPPPRRRVSRGNEDGGATAAGTSALRSCRSADVVGICLVGWSCPITRACLCRSGHSDDFNPFDDDFLEHALSASGALGYSTKGDSGGGGGPGSAVSAADGTAPPADSSVDDVSIEEDFEVCSRVSPASVYYSPDIDYTLSAVEGGVIFIKKNYISFLPSGTSETRRFYGKPRCD